MRASVGDVRSATFARENCAEENCARRGVQFAALGPRHEAVGVLARALQRRLGVLDAALAEEVLDPPRRVVLPQPAHLLPRHPPAPAPLDDAAAPVAREAHLDGPPPLQRLDRPRRRVPRLRRRRRVGRRRGSRRRARARAAATAERRRRPARRQLVRGADARFLLNFAPGLHEAAAALGASLVASWRRQQRATAAILVSPTGSQVCAISKRNLARRWRSAIGGRAPLRA